LDKKFGSTEYERGTRGKNKLAKGCDIPIRIQKFMYMVLLHGEERGLGLTGKSRRSRKALMLW
jgi:hypothetical protein